ncbi:MAG TPA: hypothetical protein VF593_04195 [Chthoniobacteraceae bacterium]|jgi:hypothetical protein
MGLFGLVFLVIALSIIGIGIAFGLVAGAMLALLVGLGVVSSSFLIGLASGQAATGFRAFLLQCGVLAGAPAGAVAAWLASWLFIAADGSVLLSGALGGAAAGVLLALAIHLGLSRIHATAVERLKHTRGLAEVSN